MKIVLVSGSSRKDSQSLKVTRWLEKKLHDLDVETEIVDLQTLELPIRHGEIWEEIESDPAAVSLRTILEFADGYVVVTPEWHGMASPALKNMFVYVKKTMADKATMLVGVSAAVGGAYPITELRASTYKNGRINYIPEQLLIRDANNVMNSDDPSEGSEADQYLKKRGLYALTVLKAYSEALKSVRDSGVIDYTTYPNGM